jgi:hypothetical protein
MAEALMAAGKPEVVSLAAVEKALCSREFLPSLEGAYASACLDLAQKAAEDGQRGCVIALPFLRLLVQRGRLHRPSAQAAGLLAGPNTGDAEGAVGTEGLGLESAQVPLDALVKAVMEGSIVRAVATEHRGAVAAAAGQSSEGLAASSPMSVPVSPAALSRCSPSLCDLPSSIRCPPDRSLHPLRTCVMNALDVVAQSDRLYNAELLAAIPSAGQKRTREDEAAEYSKEETVAGTGAAAEPTAATRSSNAPLRPDGVPRDAFLCTAHDAFLTHEPTAMEAMALVHSRVFRVFFLRRDPAHGVLGSRVSLHEVRALNHHYRVFSAELTAQAADA